MKLALSAAALLAALCAAPTVAGAAPSMPQQASAGSITPAVETAAKKKRVAKKPGKKAKSAAGKK